MTPTVNCLICYKHNNIVHGGGVRVGEVNADLQHSELLNDQVLALFILRKLLALPLPFCEKILSELENPSKWIWCCPGCANIIYSAFCTHTDLLKLQNKFDSLRETINTKLENSRNDDLNDISIPVNEKRSTMSTIDLIRNSFFYGVSSTVIDTAEVNNSNKEEKSESPISSEPSSPLKFELDPFEFEFNLTNEFDENDSNDSTSIDFNLREYEELFPVLSEELNESKKIGSRGRKQIFESSSKESEELEFKFREEDDSPPHFSSPKHNEPSKEKEKRTSFKIIEKISDAASADKDQNTSAISKEKRYKCNLCDKDFKHVTDLKSHQRGMHYKELELKPYNCKLCGKAVAARSSMISHMKAAHKTEIYRKESKNETDERQKCDICGKDFKTSGTLNIHRRGAHYNELNLKPYKCTDCGKILTTGQSLRQHITKSHKHDFALYCPVCNIGILDKKSLENHMRVHTKEKPFMCSTCGKCFAGKQALSSHEVQIHTQNYKFSCDICSKKFPDRKQFVDHNLKFHSKSPKPFVCEVCGSSFHKPVLLLYHQRGYHHKELNLEPFQCSECEAIFTDFSGLLYHKKARHASTMELKFACKECDRKFVHEGLLNLHVRRDHQKEKSFQCAQCEKSFFTAPQLKFHIQSHTKDYKFKCHLCPKGTPYKYRHERHMKTAHGLDPS